MPTQQAHPLSGPRRLVHDRRERARSGALPGCSSRASSASREPQIIAKTGWTTDELNAAIDAANPQGPFDLVTLLIGVNNQYRGRDARASTARSSRRCCNRAIGFAGGDAKKVIVVSIPDWGVTPFAEGRDRAKIAREIDQLQRHQSRRSRARRREVGGHHADLARQRSRARRGDGLHPSGKQYAEWVKLIAAASGGAGVSASCGGEPPSLRRAGGAATCRQLQPASTLAAAFLDEC